MERSITDPLSLAASISIVAILAASLRKNVRIAESRETLRTELRSEFAALRADSTHRFDAIDRKLDRILRAVGCSEARITELGQRPR